MGQKGRAHNPKLALLYLCCAHCCLPADYGCFPGSAPVIITKGAGCLDHTVTGNEESYRVLSKGRTDSSQGIGVVDLYPDRFIGGEGTQRNFEQRFPNFQLKVLAFYMQSYFFEITPVPCEDIQRISLHGILHFFIVGIGKMLLKSL